MADSPDLDLHTADTEGGDSQASTSRSRWWIAAVVLLVAAIGVALYFAWIASRRTPAPPEQTHAITPEARPPQPLGGEAEPVVVPPLDESDPLVRELVRRLSSHPQVVAWLTTDRLIRTFTVAVANVAEGVTPATHVQILRPRQAFGVTEVGENLVVDPKSYSRYDGLAQAVDSIDAAAASKLYATLKPRLDEAYRELGYLDAPFDAAVERALVRLLKTPVNDRQASIEPRGIGYGYRDERVESLSAAEKQLLRMGPANARRVQAKLREIALALGIPAERLP
jgi:hypothetical protein